MRQPRGLVWSLTGLCLAALFVTLHIALDQAIRVQIGSITIRATSAGRAALVTLALAMAAALIARRGRPAATPEARMLLTPHSGEDRLSRGWTRAFIAATLLVAGGLIAWCLATRALDPPEAFGFGDGALTELYTLHATRGIWGLGVYSRFGWHHPGPMQFYAFAPFYMAAGQHGLGLAAGALALVLLANLWLAAGLFRHARWTTALVVSGGLATYLYRLPGILTSAWNPHVLLMPYAALILLAGVAASGRPGWLPLVAGLASFVSQTHVGLAPGAVALLLCAAAAGLRNGPAASRARAVGLTMLVLAIVWMPTLYQQVTGRPGNLGRVLTFFLSETPDAPVTTKEALTAWVGTLFAPVQTGFRVADGGARPPMPDSMALALLAIGEVLLLFVSARWAARRGLLAEAWLCRCAALASVLAFLAIARIKGGLADHITFWNTVSGIVNASLLVAMGIAWLTHRGARTDSEPVPGNASDVRGAKDVDGAGRTNVDASTFAPASRVAPIAALAVVAVAAWTGLRAMDRGRAGLMAREGTPPVGRLYRDTRSAMARAGFSRPTIDLQGDWSTAAGVILQLHKHHVPFGIALEDAWMFGDPLKARGDEVGTVIFADTGQSRRLVTEPGNCLVAWSHQTFVHFRTPRGGPPPNVACHTIDEATR